MLTRNKALKSVKTSHLTYNNQSQNLILTKYSKAAKFFFIFKNGPSTASFSFIFGLLQTNNTIFAAKNVKNVHPVYGAGIQTNTLKNMSLLPLPPDHGSRPSKTFLCQ